MRTNLTKGVLLVIVLVATVVPAYAGTPLPEVPVLPAQEADVMPVEGIYVTEAETITPLENGVEVFSQRNCQDLMTIIEAGQWRLVDSIFFSLDPNQVYGTTWAVLKQGDQALMVIAKGAAADCTAVITPAPRQQVVVSGAETFEGEAAVYTMMCMADEFYSEAEGDDIDGATLISIYDLGDGTTVGIGMDVPAVLGTHEITDGGDSTVRFARSELLFPHDQFTGIPMEGEFNEFHPAYTSNVLGTVEITSETPLRGVINWTDLSNNSGESLQFTAGFECATVIGADTGFDLE